MEIKFVMNFLQGTEAKILILGGIVSVYKLALKARGLDLVIEPARRGHRLHGKFLGINE